MPMHRLPRFVFTTMVMAVAVGLSWLVTTAVFAELRQGEAEDQAERLKSLSSRMSRISPEQGGGFSIDAELSGFKDEDYVDVVKIPGIRAYSDRDGSGPRDLKMIWEMTELESLELLYDFVTDESLAGLGKLKNLEVLTLRPSVQRPRPKEPSILQYSAASLEPLGRMKALRGLDLRGNNLSDDALAEVGMAPELWSLRLDGHFGNDGLKSLGKLKSLRYLSLDGNFDDDGLAHLAQLTSLEYLTLASDRLTGAGLAHLSKLPKLRFCHLSRFGSSVSLAPLKDWPALASLSIGDRQLTDEILLTLPKLDHLTSLSIHGGFEVTDRGLAVLSKQRNLEELDLIFTRLTDDGLDTVASLSQLRALCLGEGGQVRKDITEAGLRKLSRLPRLERLDLRYVNLKQVNLQVLAIPTLTMLHLETIEHYEPKKEELRILRSRLPRLARPSSRVVIRATLTGQSEYDICANRMAIEW